MKSKTERISILGGGIIGLTTGIVLQMHGFMTRIYTAKQINLVPPTDHSRRPPELASIHAAASVLPHSASLDGIEELTRISQGIFDKLEHNSDCGVRKQKHYELFESEVSPPPYTREVERFELLSEDAWIRDRTIPKRKGAPGVWGWHFDAFFIEAPRYIQRLTELYMESGGEIETTGELSIAKFLKYSEKYRADLLVCCAGYGSLAALEEASNESVPVTRGHMVKCEVQMKPKDSKGSCFSYNYSPDQELRQYQDIGFKTKRSPQTGEEETELVRNAGVDVYFYPRCDCWLLGGTRQPGIVNLNTGVWTPATNETREEFESRGDYFKRHSGWPESIPRRVWDLNRELIKDITGEDIARYPSTSYIGYRFLTDPIRIGKELEISEKFGKPIYSNFGHGGAGYTLSWGSAWRLIAEIEQTERFKSEICEHRDLSLALPDRRSTYQTLGALEKFALAEQSERTKPDFSENIN